MKCAYPRVHHHNRDEEHDILSHYFMANKRGLSGKSDRLYLGGAKITADGDYSHKTKGHFLLGRKAMTNQDSILKRRDITLLADVHVVRTMTFPVVMYGCEIWTIKKAECQRIDAFKLWCWRRLLRVSWTAKSNQSILKEIKLQYFGDLIRRATSLEKTLMLGKVEGKRRRG